jgi:hypothetical protein
MYLSYQSAHSSYRAADVLDALMLAS